MATPQRRHRSDTRKRGASPAPPSVHDRRRQPRTAHREELKKKVRVLVSKAMSIYERTLAAAERIGAQNPFVAKTKESLDRLKQILLEEPEPAAAPATSEQQKDQPTS